MKTEDFREQLKQKGLKITPQRVAIYEAVIKLNNHPTAEKIFDYIRTTRIFRLERFIRYWIRWWKTIC